MIKRKTKNRKTNKNPEKKFLRTQTPNYKNTVDSCKIDNIEVYKKVVS